MNSAPDNASIDCLAVGLLVADVACQPIPRLPRPGELLLSGGLGLFLGGCAANVGCNLARLNQRAAVIGCVGDDPFGRVISDGLSNSGVETSGICVLKDTSTSATMITNVEGEDRRFVHAPGANRLLSPDHIPLARVKQSRVLYVGGTLLLDALDGEPLAELFRAARSAGVKTVLDCILPGKGDFWPMLAPVLPHTDVFLPNTDEAAAITGLSEATAQALRFAEAGAQTVVITCGEKGSVLVSGSERYQAGVYEVDCQSPTGAGDAFDAGYIYGLLKGGDLVTCLTYGSALGASCVRSVGATDSVFTEPELLKFVAARKLAIQTW